MKNLITNLLDKYHPVRSNAIRQSAKGEACTLAIPYVCNNDPSTTVLAHLNTSTKGTGIKSSDMAAVYACSECHAWLDQNRADEQYRLYYSLRALIGTHEAMLRNGTFKLKNNER